MNFVSYNFRLREVLRRNIMVIQKNKSKDTTHTMLTGWIGPPRRRQEKQPKQPKQQQQQEALSFQEQQHQQQRLQQTPKPKLLQATGKRRRTTRNDAQRQRSQRQQQQQGQHMLGLVAVVLFVVILVQNLATSLQQQQKLPSSMSFLFSSSSSLSSSSSSSSSSSTITLSTRQDETQEQQQPIASMASCLLVMDENARLPEWIAYHYYMLPLRHLVILVDPKSQTSPWNVIMTGWQSLLTIEIWNDTDIAFDPPQDDVAARLSRQGHFYKACTEYFYSGRYRQQQQQKQQQQQPNTTLHNTTSNKYNNNTQQWPPSPPHHHHRPPPPLAHVTWVTYHDVDEYLYLDPLLIPDAKLRMNQSGSILHLLQTQGMTRTENDKNTRTNHPNTTSSRNTSSSQINNSNHNQQQEQQQHFWNTLVQGHEVRCMVVPRTYFGAIMETPERAQLHVPSYLNGSDFDTLRFLHRTLHNDMGNNGLGKSMVRVDDNDHDSPVVEGDKTMTSNSNHPITTVENNHDRPSLQYKEGRMIHRVLKSCSDLPGGLRIRHYLGTWDAYTNRPDARRSQEMYEFRAQLGHDTTPDDDVRSWLTQFCHDIISTIQQEEEEKQQHDDNKNYYYYHHETQVELDNPTSFLQSLFQGTGHFPSMSHEQGDIHVHHMTALEIQKRIQEDNKKKKRYRNSNSLGNWLVQHYELTTLSNQTLVAKRIK